MKIEEILAQYLSEIESGESTLEEVLAKQPELREELEPLLRLALSLAAPFSLTPSPSSKRLARAELLERISSLSVTRGGLSRYFSWIDLNHGRRPKMMPTIVSLLVAFFVATGGGVAYASQGSLPGDVLYPVKIALEQVQVGLATSDEAKSQAFLLRAERRLRELAIVAGLGNGNRVRELAKQYEENIDEALESLEQGGERGKDVGELLERFQENLDRQQSVMERVEERVSEQARDAIAHAMEVSRRGKEKASEAAERWQARHGEPTPSTTITPTVTLTITSTVTPTRKTEEWKIVGFLKEKHTVAANKEEWLVEGLHYEEDAPTTGAGRPPVVEKYRFVVNEDTRVTGRPPVVGAHVVAKGEVLPDGSRLALKVEVGNVPPTPAASERSDKPDAQKTPDPTETPKPIRTPAPTNTPRPGRGRE